MDNLDLIGDSAKMAELFGGGGIQRPTRLIWMQTTDSLVTYQCPRDLYVVGIFKVDVGVGSQSLAKTTGFNVFAAGEYVLDDAAAIAAWSIKDLSMPALNYKMLAGETIYFRSSVATAYVGLIVTEST